MSVLNLCGGFAVFFSVLGSRMRILVGGGKARANRRVGRLLTAVGPATS